MYYGLKSIKDYSLKTTFHMQQPNTSLVAFRTTRSKVKGEPFDLETEFDAEEIVSHGFFAGKLFMFVKLAGVDTPSYKVVENLSCAATLDFLSVDWWQVSSSFVI